MCREENAEVKDCYIVDGCDCVKSAEVYGLASSIRRAKYPYSTDTDKPSSELTKVIAALAYSKKGEGHDQWLTGIVVQMDLCFSNKAWVEAERYRFLYFISSQSTMHRITSFDLDLSYSPYTDKAIVGIMKDKVDEYKSLLKAEANEEILKEKYLEILYSNPAGFKLTAGITTNYRQLKTIYSQRKNHRLPEWRAFCKWIETLPYSHLITGGEEPCA